MASSVTAAVSTSFLLTKSASSINKMNHSHVKIKPPGLSLNLNRQQRLQFSSTRRPLIVQATYSDDGRPSSASLFVGGFILGGLIVGTLGAVYAPQISNAIAGTDRKELMRKLPKFIYDEEKALEVRSACYWHCKSVTAIGKTRKVLANKIEQLNAAIDEISSQLRSEQTPNGVAVNSDEVEAAT
ncbi:hypothetical protein L195_g025621 [Trifolium pratense]|uniref:Uncharacterized protein n=1 Tax=Trifolium pratense TaxID=57577 RepID=A0A2K3N3U9_TRIPR|nr:hypothetical protein L195_g020935 [Trifolium pratense]PNY02205.1 hypothetical protein L195_g025510 [Trifolium pratense]PNY02315.1 hypothetical protein L195_g025621 [Trifolium pratense]